MVFAKIIKRQGEAINRQEKENTKLKEENSELRFECEELQQFKDRIRRIMNNADLTKENYFVTFKKIKKELISDDQSQN